MVRLNEVQSIRPQLDLWEKPERMRGFLALLYLHSKFKNRLKDVQLFLRQNCLRNTPFLLLFFFNVQEFISVLCSCYPSVSTG